MFTDQLLRDYCLQIREIEERMEMAYREIEAELILPEYRRFFARLLVDEREHQQRIDTILEYFGGEEG